MELFCREIGKGDETLVIIHGLYGSSDNWITIASRLEDKFRVILPDLRNHGRSPHSEVHDFDSMAADLYETARAGFRQNHSSGTFDGRQSSDAFCYVTSTNGQQVDCGRCSP